MISYKYWLSVKGSSQVFLVFSIFKIVVDRFYIIVFLLAILFIQSCGQTSFIPKASGQCLFNPPNSALKKDGRYYIDDHRIKITNGLYYEGFRRTEHIASGSLIAKSIAAIPSRPSHHGRDRSYFFLNFYVPASLANRKLCIMIEDRERNYYVIAVETQYPEGFHSFAWKRSELADSAGIILENLIGTIKSQRPIENLETYLPVHLGFHSQKVYPRAYDFSFIANSEVSYAFYINKTVKSGRVAEGQSIDFSWNCKQDSSGFLEVGIRSRFQGQPKPSRQYLQFYHLSAQ